MFGSSAVARSIVRSTMTASENIAKVLPDNLKRWADSRFCKDVMIMENGAAFDLIRASVNLVLAGLLIALGTSLKLPLSTTYVTFMVAMGSSLADRAWSRDSAVYRITRSSFRHRWLVHYRRSCLHYLFCGNTHYVLRRHICYAGFDCTRHIPIGA